MGGTREKSGEKTLNSASGVLAGSNPRAVAQPSGSSTWNTVWASTSKAGTATSRISGCVASLLCRQLWGLRDRALYGYRTPGLSLRLRDVLRAVQLRPCRGELSGLDWRCRQWRCSCGLFFKLDSDLIIDTVKRLIHLI